MEFPGNSASSPMILPPSFPCPSVGLAEGEQMSCLLNLSSRKLKNSGSKCHREGENKLASDYASNAEQGLMKEDFSSFLTINTSHKICAVPGTTYKCYQHVGKKASRRWKLSQLHFHRPVCFPQSPDENCYGQTKDMWERKLEYAQLEMMKLKKIKLSWM